MRHRQLRAGGSALALALFAGCMLLTESVPRITNITVARERWLASPPRDYSFEIHFDCFCGVGPRRVQVTGGTVVAATDLTGKPVANFTMTLATLWDYVLASRERGDLVSAAFDSEGVPVNAEIGQLANDSGVRYTVRNFRRSR